MEIKLNAIYTESENFLAHKFRLFFFSTSLKFSKYPNNLLEVTESHRSSMTQIALQIFDKFTENPWEHFLPQTKKKIETKSLNQSVDSQLYNK